MHLRQEPFFQQDSVAIVSATKGIYSSLLPLEQAYFLHVTFMVFFLITHGRTLHICQTIRANGVAFAILIEGIAVTVISQISTEHP